jgi:DNA topoisomerase-3
MVIVQPGWTKYDDFNQKDRILPPLNKGDIVNIDFQPYERETSPPKHYTIETLNNYLKNPFRDEKNATDENDEEDYRAIFEGLELGTEATRTGIIDNARKSEYIELKKDVYKILPRGEYLIESLMQMGISMDKYKTSEMGKMLKQIYRSTATIEEGIRQAEREIASVFYVEQKPIEQETDNGFYLDKVGQCPLCGKDVIKGRYGYGCTGYKDGCKFKINGVICKRVISKGNAELLLKTGKTSKIEGFISKAGKEFSATLKLENGEVKFDFN